MISQGWDVQRLTAGLSPPSIPAGVPSVSPKTHPRRWCSRCPGDVPCPGRWPLSSAQWYPGEGQGTGVTALLGLPQWPVPIAVGQVLRDNLSEDMAGHGKVPSSALGAVQAHHSSLWCKLQNSAHPRQDVAGNAEGMTRRTCPLSKAPSRMSFTVQRVCTRASLRSDWREPHHTRSLCCSSPAHGSSI